MLAPCASCLTPIDLDDTGSELVDTGMADVWSLAITLLGCRLGVHPWDAARATDPRYQVWAATWTHLRRAPSGTSAADTATRTEAGVAPVGGRDLPVHTATALGRALVVWCGVPEGDVAGSWSPALLGLVARMLDPEPATRLTLDEVLRHPWMVEGVGACAEAGVELEAGGKEGGGDSASSAAVSCSGACSPGAVSAPESCLGMLGRADVGCV